MDASNSISTTSDSDPTEPKCSDYSDSMLKGLSPDSTSTQYRFSGYQLPTDSDGNYVVKPHPYFSNQPTYWEKPCYPTNFKIVRPSMETLKGDKLTGLLPLT